MTQDECRAARGTRTPRGTQFAPSPPHAWAAAGPCSSEAGQLKKGTATAGTGRQYTGTAGRVENAIVALYTTYATTSGHALIDRDLYVQKHWFTDPTRMAKAGFPPDHAFTTKPQLAKAQAERALDTGITPRWATGDEVYGRSGELRELFETRGIGYVFAVGVDFTVTTSGHQEIRADQALTLVESAGWNRRSCGAGAKGPRYYDWAWIATASPRHQLLIRRSVSDPTELAHYLAHAPAHYVCSLTDLVKAAGTRWAVEDDFQDSMGTVGLDQTQVRTYRAWKRHVTLAMAACALLAVTTALARRTHPAPVLPDDIDQAAPADCGMIALTVPDRHRACEHTSTRGAVPGEVLLWSELVYQRLRVLRRERPRCHPMPEPPETRRRDPLSGWQDPIFASCSSTPNPVRS